MTRLLSAVALLVVLGGAAWFSPPEGLLAIAVGIACLAFVELARLGDALGARVPRVPGLVLTALVCYSVAWPGASPRKPLDAVRDKTLWYHESVTDLSRFGNIPPNVKLRRRQTVRTLQPE